MPLTSEIESALAAGLRQPVRVAARRPSPYRTSFPLEELDVELGDGTRLALVLKELSWGNLGDTARRAKPRFLHDPLRELEVYRTVLDPLALGTAKLYGSGENGRPWLLLERIPGPDLTQVGDFEIWREAARWLARMHDRCRDLRTSRLLSHDESFHRRWFERARKFRESEELEPLVAGYDALAVRLADLPRGFIHGEFYASNILVEEGKNGVRICPIDWELAAVGPALIDLAALTAGSWSEEERTELALAYRDSLSEPPSANTLLEDLDLCRLQVALQWLGWSRDWTPPPERQQDWLGEALRLGKRLGP